MNTNTPYEHLIAAKLDQVPVPDMADSIWASIEAQLDAPVEIPDQKTTPKIKGKGWYGFAGITVVVTALWWYTNHTNHSQKNTTPENIPTVPEMPAPIIDSPALKDNTEKKTVPFIPPPAEKDSIAREEMPVSSIRKDSAAEQVFPLFKPDSSFWRYDKTPLPAIDSVNTAPHPKKPKGVKGISDNDYKISAGKDSARKKE
ncbi:hypothetical protein [Chitinophaga sp. OAE865]|uniref:hypothetical protein n=1 Tax=Chitinophaga sp. OAE865 TaxID=2817898 RepID=UPI001AE18634